MDGNKLLTGFLVLGMGLSLVACSNEKPETKKEEAKVAEKKKEEKQIVTQDRTAKLSIVEDLSPYFTSSREGVGKMEGMVKDNGSIVYKCLNEENKYELNAEIKLLSSSSAEKSADLQNSMYGKMTRIKSISLVRLRVLMRIVTPSIWVRLKILDFTIM